MPTNYNFKENWYEVIVPLLNTQKVKAAIKKGILGYMNNEINPDIKFKSYQNIYDYLNNKHSNYYLNKNSSPADYSSRITDNKMEWENDLIDTLNKTHMIEPFPWDNYDEEKKKNTNPQLEYEKYREEYLDPFLEPYINNYKKTHMNSYCLVGGCHWWNPTFCLTLANIVMPNEKWRPKKSDYHTTIVNSDNTKIFDILYFDEMDTKSFGGNNAYESASMTLDEIRKRNNKQNEQSIKDKVNNQLYNDLDEIEKTINKMETTIFEFKMKIIDELFPNARFDICIDFNDLHKVVTTKKKVTLIQTFDCYCYESCPRSIKTFIIKSNKPMTIRYIINELIKQDFELDCNHRCLESLEVNDNIIEYGTGS